MEQHHSFAASYNTRQMAAMDILNWMKTEILSLFQRETFFGKPLALFTTIQRKIRGKALLSK